MRSVFLAAAFGLAASQAGAVAISAASGAVTITLVLDDAGDGGKLSSAFVSGPDADRFRDPADPSGAVGGDLSYETADDWPDDASAVPLDFSGSASAKVTADGAPPPSFGLVGGFIDDVFFASIDIENKSTASVGFKIMLDYTLDASVSFDRAGDEDFATTADADISFLLFDGQGDIVADEIVSVYADAFPGAGPILSDSVSDSWMWSLVLDAGQIASLDIELGVAAEARSDGFGATPIPVPPALALLPAGLALLAAAGRRRKG